MGSHSLELRQRLRGHAMGRKWQSLMKLLRHGSLHASTRSVVHCLVAIIVAKSFLSQQQLCSCGACRSCSAQFNAAVLHCNSEQWLRMHSVTANSCNHRAAVAVGAALLLHMYVHVSGSSAHYCQIRCTTQTTVTLTPLI
jgi:hypothetical protein